MRSSIGEEAKVEIRSKFSKKIGNLSGRSLICILYSGVRPDSSLAVKLCEILHSELQVLAVGGSPSKHALFRGCRDALDLCEQLTAIFLEPLLLGPEAFA